MSKIAGGKKHNPQVHRNKYDSRPYPKRREEDFEAWKQYRKNQRARKR
jgi:hypothetical protein